MRLLLAAITAGALALAPATVAGTHGSLHVLRSSPLTLSGTGFAPHEQVRLTVYASRATTLRAVADAQGRLLARLSLRMSGCTLWTARAVGTSAAPVAYVAPKRNCANQNNLIGTGIAGQVTRGPITPVCHAEEPCDGPAPNLAVTISQHGSAVAATTLTTTSADGTFATSLTPGRYTVAVGRTTPQTVDVKVGQVANLEFKVDTGIR